MTDTNMTKLVKIIKSSKTLNCYELFMDKTCCPIWIRLSSFYIWRSISGQGSLDALKGQLQSERERTIFHWSEKIPGTRSRGREHFLFFGTVSF